MTAALWLFLWLLGAQSSSASAIQGVVVRAGTDQPIPDEIVGLWPTNRVAKTDQNGRFLFREVAPGDYLLTVIHDGIRQQVPLAITAAQRFESITIQVKQAPAITGTVFDPNGERAAATLVQAFRTVYSVRGPQLRSVLSVPTDDLGEFRLFRLRPGQYYVSASLSDRDQRIATSGLRLSPNLSKPDEGFPAVYFGGGYSPSTSQVVGLAPNTDASGLQIFLKDGRRFAISGRLVSPEPSICARVALVPEGGVLNPDTDFVVETCNTFRIEGVSPGIYYLLAMNDQYVSEITPVSIVDRDAQNVGLPLSRLVEISGRVSGPGVRSLAGVRVILSRSVREISQVMTAPVAAAGTFSLRIGRGTYDVSVSPLPEASFIDSIRYKVGNGLTAPIRVDFGAPGRLEILLAVSNVRAEGVVVDRSARPVPGAEVVLVPRANRNRADRYFATTADAGGNFRVGGIPPGDYVVFAFEEVEPQAYYAFSYDPSLFTSYIGKGQILSAGGDSQMRLVAIPASETAGGLR